MDQRITIWMRLITASYVTKKSKAVVMMSIMYHNLAIATTAEFRNPEINLDYNLTKSREIFYLAANGFERIFDEKNACVD